MTDSKNIHIFKTVVQMLLRGEINKVRKNRKQILFGLPIKRKTLNTKEITILTTKHTLFVAHGLMIELKNHGIKTNIVTELKNHDHGQLFIVIAPQVFKTLPWNYIIYQVEQLRPLIDLKKKYQQILKNALAVLDYSTLNIQRLVNLGVPLNKIFYLPITPIENYCDFLESQGYLLETNPVKDIDVLFYGSPKSKRCSHFLKEIQNKVNVFIAFGIFENDMINLIRRSKVVINIHYYENALLETTRISEVLSLGTPIISEKSFDLREREDFKKYVKFTPLGNIDEMINCLLEQDQKSVRNEKGFHELANDRKLFFSRFLLWLGIIDYKEYYSSLEKMNYFEKYDHVTPKFCLSLSETPIRRNSFLKENLNDFQIFEGIRDKKSWIGCALSYKLLASWAKKNNSELMIICEDDVYLPDDFKEKYHKIYNYLIENKEKWDIFVGVIADLHDNTQIKNIDCHEGIEYIYLDKMVSMVFNIYNKSILETLSHWDETDLNIGENTIDRYLENKHNLRVVTCVPFLTGHKEDLDSSIWGHSNTAYSKMIKQSEEKLEDKISRYKEATTI